LPKGIPICVDLDGTLCRGDSLVRLGLVLAARRPWLLPRYALWALGGGRARLKDEIARRQPFDAGRFAYQPRLLDWLAARKAEGHRLVLASGSDRRVVEAVAAHTGLFDEVLASDGRVNLTGPRKAAALAGRFPAFAYIGNSRADLPVWRQARACYLVARSPRVEARLGSKVAFLGVFHSRARPPKSAA
jgi:FMN phosphatase YigB (HAD superfamily)